MEVSGGNKIHMQGRSIAAINIKCRAKSRCRGLPFSLSLSLLRSRARRARKRLRLSLSRWQIHMHELMKQVAFGAGNESRQRAARIHYNRICVRILYALAYSTTQKADRPAERPAALDSSRTQLWSQAKLNTRKFGIFGCANTPHQKRPPAEALRFVWGTSKMVNGLPNYQQKQLYIHYQ